MNTSPFQILGVPEGSDEETCKRAWKQRVRENHPDRHPPEKRQEQAEKLAKINQAFDRIKAGDTAPPLTHTPPPNTGFGFENLFAEFLRRTGHKPTHEPDVIGEFPILDPDEILTTVHQSLKEPYEQLLLQEWKEARKRFFARVIKGLFNAQFHLWKVREKPPLVVFPVQVVIVGSRIQLRYAHSSIPQNPNTENPVFLYVPALKRTRPNLFGQRKWGVSIEQGGFVRLKAPLDHNNRTQLKMSLPEGTHILDVSHDTRPKASTALRLKTGTGWLKKWIYTSDQTGKENGKQP